MVLGKLPVPGRPTDLIRVGQGPTALAVGAGRGCFGHFYSRLSFLFLPLSGMARYGLKYCLKGPLSTKQPTNRIIVDICALDSSLSRTPSQLLHYLFG